MRFLSWFSLCSARRTGGDRSSGGSPLAGRRPRSPRSHGPLTFERLEERLLLSAPHPLELSTLDGGNGYVFEGINTLDNFGISVRGAGDVNGDGFDDLLIGAHAASPGTVPRLYAGETYLVFGGAANLAALDAADGTVDGRINVANLDGTNGFRLEGVAPLDGSGLSAAGVGDVNGDGFDDLLIGAYRASPGTIPRLTAGESYLLFGGLTNLAALDAADGAVDGRVNLGNLNGTTGFILEGISPLDQSGDSVSRAGDVNGDGFEDFLIGARRADPGGRNYAGETYLVFGGLANLAALDAADGAGDGRINLVHLNGTSGFIFEGINPGDFSGISVSGAGDVNGDGLEDVLIGSFGASPGGRVSAAETYLIFGGLPNLSTLDAVDGASNGRIILSNLNGTTGFIFEGIADFDYAGRSVSGAGDVDGDGFDDILIGAPGADPGGQTGAGETYLIFGGPANLGGLDAADGISNGRISLASLNGTNGFRLAGILGDDRSGRSVSGAGDINGDGFDDLLIGAYTADPGIVPRVNAGVTYVVFGGRANLAALDNADSTTDGRIRLAHLDGNSGFRVEGVALGDLSGRSVSGAGDVNGDGFDDLLIGARYADPGLRLSAGEAYLVFGGNFTGGAETQVGGAGNQTLNANQGAGRDVLIGGLDDDTLISDGGPDVLRGAHGSDVLTLVDIDFSGTRRWQGGLGRNTLRLAGGGLHLDLTALPDNRLREFETLDIRGSGANTLTLNLLEVLNLSKHSNTVTVLRHHDDSVNIGSGWTSAGKQFDGSLFYDVFTQGAATLRIQDPTVIVTGSTAAVFGQDFDQTFLFFLAGHPVVVVDGVQYNLPASVNFVRLDGAGGRDTLTIHGTSGNDRAVFLVDRVHFDFDPAHPGFDFIGWNVEEITILGNGGNDTAVMHDSPGDDSFVASPTLATLAGNGFRNQVLGFSTVIAQAGNGGVDHAVLTDSPGVDRFVSHPATAFLQGPGFHLQVSGFPTVRAISQQGGADLAFLHDSPGDDVFTVHPRQGTLAGPGFLTIVQNFHTIVGRALAGGSDKAFLHDGPNDDVFATTLTTGNFTGQGFFNSAFGFGLIEGRSIHGGHDRAFLEDSPGDDRFATSVGVADLSGVGFFRRTRGFASVSARALHGGFDIATLRDTPGNDKFVSRAAVSFFSGGGFFTEAVQFERVSAHAETGGFNQAFLEDTAGDDVFTAQVGMASLVGSGLTRHVVGFDAVAGWALHGGADTATFFDTPGNDTFSATPQIANLASPNGLYLQALGFESVTARAIFGGQDRAFLFDSPGDDLFFGRGANGTLSGPGFSNLANLFETVALFGSTGLNRLDARNLGYVLIPRGSWVVV
jgi:hypothetical protein